jgi:uncharacterized membrane protein YjgN (DUF898 family)
LTGLSFLNVLLAVVTLGIYQFWGRTEVRRRIWSSVHIADEPLAYTGTGKELFLGFLIVFGVVLLPTLAISIGGLLAFGPNSPGYAATQMVMAVVFLFLGGVAIYRARRYRLSRTNWRGIRGSLEGSSWGYGWTSFWTAMIVPVLAVSALGALFFVVTSNSGTRAPTLPVSSQVSMFLLQYGRWVVVAYIAAILLWLLLVPWRTTKLQRIITNDMAFGSRPFSFNGSARPLYLRFIARWIGVLLLAVVTPAIIYVWLGAERASVVFAPRSPGAPPTTLSTRETLGILAILAIAFILYSVITAWYKAAESRYYASVTSYEGQSFSLSITAWGLIGLFIINALITIVSLGILRPVAMARTAKYFTENLALTGPIDVRAIAQSQAAMSKTGEGLAQAFDVDAF